MDDTYVTAVDAVVN